MGADTDVDAEAVAARHAAGGIDDHRIERVLADAIGKTDPQRACFMNARAPAAARTRRDCERNAPDRPVAGEDFVA